TSQAWQPLGKVGGTLDEPLASRPVPNFVVGPAGRKNALATSVIGMARSVPTTANLPAWNSMSFDEASRRCAAISLPFSMIASAAPFKAELPSMALREA